MKTVDFIKQQFDRINNGETLIKDKQCASVFATSDRIYSYGYHYPLLFQIDTPNNGLLWVCNNGGYSATTGKHISYSNYLSDVSAPIGGTNGNTIDYNAVIDAVLSLKNSILDKMLSKKRKDTFVYQDLERQYLKACNDYELLT